MSTPATGLAASTDAAQSTAASAGADQSASGTDAQVLLPTSGANLNVTPSTSAAQAPSCWDQTVAAVTMKLPAFFGASSGVPPALWFAQAESQFALRGITNQMTRYHHVVSALDTSTLQEVADLLARPPAQQPYDTLKKTILERLSTSREQRLHELLYAATIGDRLPSAFLRHLRTLAPDDVTESLLRSIWSSRLPQQIRVAIAGRDHEPLETVAKLADDVTQVLRSPATSVCATTANLPSPGSNQDLRDQVAALTDAVSALRSNFRQDNSRHRSSRSPERSSSPSRRKTSPSRRGYCFYHERFGSSARNCTKPCSYQGNDARSQ